MSHETSLTPEETHVETLLGQLHPTVSTQGRDKLMFQAGRASAGQVHLWQHVTGEFALLLLCSLTISTLPVTPEPAIMIPQLVSNARPFKPEVTSPRELDELAYIHVRHSVLKHGLDALPETRSGRGVTADRMRYGDAFKKYMNL